MDAPDHPFEDGLLSETAREVRSEVRRKCATHVELLYLTNRHAVALQHALEIQAENLQQAIGAALYARTLASTQSSALLLDRHVVLDASGHAVEFQNEPDTSSQEAVWAWATEVQLASMRSVAAVFSMDCKVIDSLSRRLREVATCDDGVH